MFKIDAESNSITPLRIRSFSELGFKERRNLQEWIANRPDCLGEELLIIQKEFAGFTDTQERLDLLAIDKQGALVIIENKLDDTGRDVTWQALKYASYSAGLTKENIRKIYQSYLDKYEPGNDAEQRIIDFLEKDDFDEITLNTGFQQRIILIAANFRKEVTSTVLWLLNYDIRLQCFKVTPFSKGEELFLNIDQIIPTKDAEEFMIGLAEKTREEVSGSKAEIRRKKFRHDFWSETLIEMNKKTDRFRNISPSEYAWIGAGSGIRGIGFNLVVAKTYGRAEVYIDRGNKEENKEIFDRLLKHKDKIESDAGKEFVWERLDDKRSCRIKLQGDGNLYQKELWPDMIENIVDSLIRIEKAFEKPLNDLSRYLKGQS